MDRALLAVVAIALSLCFQPAQAVVPPVKQPAWVELSADQREILAPLAGEWDQFEYSRRKKWLGIAERYPSMKAEEQARVQRRMLEWVKLSPEQRTQAREKFKNLQKSAPERKEAIKQKWQEYKDLPEEEKQRLQAEAAARPKGTAKNVTPSNGQRPATPPLPALGSLQSPPATPAPLAPVAPVAPAIVLPPSGN